MSSESLAVAGGAASVQTTVTAVDDSDPEGAETVAVTARHGGAAIGSASMTIEASDAVLPAISIAAATSPVAEGTAAAFTLTRTGPTTEALTVAVSVTESGAMLAANPPSSVRFGIGETSATLTAVTDDDAVVEGASAVTAAIASGESYAAAADAGSAQVSVEDNDTAEFTVSFDAAAIAEGQAATLTVAIANGVTFAEDQTIALDFAGGTAAQGTDYTVSSESLSLAAGATSVRATLTAVDDSDAEGAETVAVAARHGGASIGSASMTIQASDAALLAISIAAGTSPVTEGTAAAFTLTRTGATAEALTVAVSVTESGAMLAANPPSSVTFGTGESSVTLTAATDDDAVVEGASAVTAAIASGEGHSAAAAASAQVSVEDNDAPSWAVSPDTVEIAEGATATLTVSAGAVSFAEAQVLVIRTAGTADASDFTLSPAAPQLPAGAGSVAVSVTAVDDATEEEAEALRLTVLHGGVEVGTATVTIAASDAGTGDATPADRAEALRRAESDLDDLSEYVPFGLWAEDGTLWSAMWWSVGLVAFDLETHGRLPGRDITVASDNPSPTGLWSDGTTLWVADHFDAHVYAYRLADKARDEDREFALDEGTRAFGLWSDGTTVWTADFSEGRVAAYRLADGVRDADRDYDTSRVGNEAPVSLWSDGETLWVGDRFDEKLYAYALEAEASADATLAALTLSGVDIGAFDAAATDYAAAVGPAVASTTVTATPSNAGASVTIADSDGSTTDGPRDVSLAVGANTITATVTAADGQTTATYTVTVTRAYPLPAISIAAGTSPVTEGTAAVFTLTRTGSTAEALTVAVSVTESGTMLAANPPASATFDVGESSGTLTAATDDDAVVEGASVVTAAFAGGEGYSAAANAGSAQVSVEDNVAAAFTVTAAPEAIAEGESATLTVAIANGVTFAEDQTIALEFAGGTAAKGTDYTVSSESVVLTTGSASVRATVTAVDDTDQEGAETVAVTARHGGAAIGSASVTIEASDAALPEISIAAGTSPVTEGTAAAFTLTRTGATTEALTVAVSVTESGTMLAANPPSSVTFGTGESSVTLTAATDDDAVVEGASAVTAAFAGGEGYSAAANAGSAQVSVEDNDAAAFTVTAAPEAIAEGESATLTVAIANGVTFAEDQTVELDFTAGTATHGTDYTVSAESLALAAGATAVRATLTVVDDTDPEGAETVAVAARHGGAAIGSASVTIEASDAALPAISIAAGTSPVTEGTEAAFTLTRTGLTTEALTVAVSVTESGAMLAANPPASLTFGNGESSVTLAAATDDDAVVEGSSAVTAAVANGEGYSAAAGADSAQVTVEDNDTAAFTVTAAPEAIAEGESATLTVAVSNGRTESAWLSCRCWCR